MSNNIEGIILSGLGGLYSVKAESGEVYPCRAKGAFRKAKLTPLVGDRVSIRPPEVAGEEYFIEKIYPRQNALIRPPMANLETLFVTFAPKIPSPARFISINCSPSPFIITSHLSSSSQSRIFLRVLRKNMRISTAKRDIASFSAPLRTARASMRLPNTFILSRGSVRLRVRRALENPR